MKKIAAVFALFPFLVSAAGSHHVSPYTRSDGTYVRGHYRSNPDSTRSNNYGSPSSGSYSYGTEWDSKSKDYDNDGTYNYQDMDDDNDGILDDNE